ncbi:MAG: MarR family winged helix-turn-helix transcriptional regulator [Bryobacteraceae bacterium]|nr:MarR family winged helix-turn-helix transcriptional regulator [Bryobacteraceae bacterium]
MTLEEAVLEVQRAYPRVYLACHRDHKNSRTTAEGLSPRDSSILAHLNEREWTPQGLLGRHLGIAKSTLSEAVGWLMECGFLSAERGEDGREQRLRLTEKGLEAMRGSSVLESDRLAEVLATLTVAERDAAVKGLQLLAEATRRRAMAAEGTCA